MKKSLVSGFEKLVAPLNIVDEQGYWFDNAEELFEIYQEYVAEGYKVFLCATGKTKECVTIMGSGGYSMYVDWCASLTGRGAEGEALRVLPVNEHTYLAYVRELIK